MRSQTGAIMSLGKGAVYSSSMRQKLNTRSSTEAELVGVDDAMGMIQWTRLFLTAQGYQVNDTKLYQDNQSAMLMEKHGKRSSTKRTRHLNIRYFFITDCIQNGHVGVEYCPTEHMLADLLIKPLQGSVFRKFRDAILNLNDSCILSRDAESQECVGNGIDDCRLSCMRGCSEEDSEQEEDTTEVVTESKTSGGDEKK
jgi:hypothetical protein